ncbi:hypothetical protein DCAR_0726827 [Daucus carota subsp. sativus]|uniref:Peroxiredoxin n=1 Tax=Daucus carota subsp. sativus TaxID=79200 RepID=A0AAF0XHZ5_DAUCS|nr:hypothetical protein DCAR_0726827 [Daucus carota subsp. sativus]
MPGLTIGDTLPNLEIETTHGKMKLHDYVGDSFTIIFSHPGDFTPVCTTELGAMAAYANQFAQRGVKLLGLSCDDVQSHHEWIKDIEAFNGGHKVNYPIGADPKREIIKELNMVDPDEKDSAGNHTPFLYPASTGRNMDEVVRAVDSLLTAEATKKKIATPANWKKGEKVVIAPSVDNDEAKKIFPQGFDSAKLPSGKDYLRFTNV